MTRVSASVDTPGGMRNSRSGAAASGATSRGPHTSRRSARQVATVETSSGTAEFARRVLPWPKRQQPATEPLPLDARPCQRRRVLEVANVGGAHRRGAERLDHDHVVGGDVHHVTAFGAHLQRRVRLRAGGRSRPSAAVPNRRAAGDRTMTRVPIGGIGISDRTDRDPRRASTTAPALPSRATSPCVWRCGHACRPAGPGTGTRPDGRSRAAASARTDRCPRA